MKLIEILSESSLEKIYEISTRRQFVGLLNRSTDGALRAFLEGGKLWAWDAYFANHEDLEQEGYGGIPLHLYADKIEIRLHGAELEMYRDTLERVRGSDLLKRIYGGVLPAIWSDSADRDSVDLKQYFGESRLVEGIELANGTPLYRNPGKAMFWSLLGRSENKELRGIIADTGEVYIWDAYYATHHHVLSELGIDGIYLECDRQRAIDPNGYVDDVYEYSHIVALWYEV